MLSLIPTNHKVLGVLVIPLYNEAKRWNPDYFVNLHSRLRSKNWRLVFVDDGSTDGTGDILQTFCANWNCLAMGLDKNSGKSDAVRKGLLFAAARFPDASFLGILDADGAFDVVDVEKLIDFASSGKSDITIGSRVKLSGLDIQRKTSRHLIGRLVSTIVNLLFFQLTVYDPQSGLKIYFNNSRLIRSLGQPFRTRWFGDVELLLRLERDGELVVREHAISSWRDIEGSKLQISSALFIFVEILKLLLIRVRTRRR